MAIITSMTDKQPRGQTEVLCKALQNKHGLTAQELLAETGGTTPHNSWSLQRIADRFGFKFETFDGSEYEDGLRRYRFQVKAAKAAKAVSKIPVPQKAAAKRIPVMKRMAAKIATTQKARAKKRG